MPTDHIFLLRQDIWAIKLRYLWLVIQLLLALLALTYGYLQGATFALILGAIVIFFLINLRLHFLTWKGGVPGRFFSYQIEGDLIVFIVFLLLSGGTQNPFYPFFYIIIFLIGLYTGPGNFWPRALIVFFASFSLQVFPYLSTAHNIITKETLPYLLIQFSIPLITFFIARSLGIKLVSAYLALEKIQRKEEKISRLKAMGAMSAGLSHEFASPLHAAQLRMERIKRKLTQDEDVEECLLALEDCSRTLHLMNKVHQDLTSTHFEIITHQDIKVLANEWLKDNPEVTLNLFLNDFEISSPKLSFIQAFFNILDNAKEAQKNPVIEINCQGKKLSIKDLGTGFPPHVLERIGEPFNTYRLGGTGLGLYSTELFMTSVGAELRIASSQEGSTIELDFA